MQTITCSETGIINIESQVIPGLSSGELLVRMNACGICGTDVTKVYDDYFRKPVQLGHELVATVVESKNENFRTGQRVAIAHHAPDYASHYTRRGSAPMDLQFKRSNIDPGGFAELIRIPELLVQHTVLPVPDGMPDLRAVFMEPLACCLRALDRILLLEGDTVVIVGVGAVGMLFVPLLRDRTINILVSDVRKERLELAKVWGASGDSLVSEGNIAELAKAETDRRGADVVILTVVTRATLEVAMESVRDGGTILLFGTKPAQSFPINWWDIWRREINLISSYSSTPDLLTRAMALLKRKDYALETLISHVLPLSEAPRGFQLVHDGAASKVVITGE
ncbi:MAG: alcohol dehydrogenase catalytic domain-containing protein [Caldilineaceae bacterium]